MSEDQSIKQKIAVIGGGSWATAIVKILGDNQQNEISWWMREESSVEHVRAFGHNPKYLGSVQVNILPENISTDLQAIVSGASCIILAIPAAFLKTALDSCSIDIFEGKLVVSAIKGIVPEDNLIIADFLEKQYFFPIEKFLVLTGPCHAEEVAFEKLSYLTVAGKDPALARRFAGSISTRYIKTVISDDIYGTEYAAVLKNVVAIACGICHGLGYGDNFQAVLVSNAIREMKRFVDAVHPIQRDIMDSAYLGDLLVTAYSQFSRNRTFGNMLGKGYSVKSAQLEMNMIAEGYYASACIHQINLANGTSMPIMEAVYRILYENKSPASEIKKLSENLN